MRWPFVSRKRYEKVLQENRAVHVLRARELTEFTEGEKRTGEMLKELDRELDYAKRQRDHFVKMAAKEAPYPLPEFPGIHLKVEDMYVIADQAQHFYVHMQPLAFQFVLPKYNDNHKEDFLRIAAAHCATSASRLIEQKLQEQWNLN